MTTPTPSENVKNEIDAQSGRFEFFKQAVTLGLAGLAGTAAFFTDTSKIPSDPLTAGAIVVMALMLLWTVGASLMGLSTYANLLKAHANSETTVANLRTSMISHAKQVFVAIGLTATAFAAYAGLQFANRKDSAVTAADAVGIAKKAAGVGGCEATLETLSRKADNVIASLRSDGCKLRFTVTVKTGGGEVTSISSTPLT
jgi:hypothetical protein